MTRSGFSRCGERDRPLAQQRDRSFARAGRTSTQRGRMAVRVVADTTVSRHDGALVPVAQIGSPTFPERGWNMDSIVSRYQGKKSSEGHEVIVTQTQGVISLSFKHSGEYEDDYDPDIQIARIEREGDAYRVGWFYADAEEPSDSSEYTREEDLFAALDRAIEQRSKEAESPAS